VGPEAVSGWLTHRCQSPASLSSLMGADTFMFTDRELATKVSCSAFGHSLDTNDNDWRLGFGTFSWIEVTRFLLGHTVRGILGDAILRCGDTVSPNVTQ